METGTRQEIGEYLHSRGGWWEKLSEDGLIVMAGKESMEWSQTCGVHMFDVFDTVP
jgi:hypothetical protein